MPADCGSSNDARSGPGREARGVASRYARRRQQRLTRSRLDIKPSLEVSIELKSSITLIDLDAILARSRSRTADAPDFSASAILLAACEDHQKRQGRRTRA